MRSSRAFGLGRADASPYPHRPVVPVPSPSSPSDSAYHQLGSPLFRRLPDELLLMIVSFNMDRYPRTRDRRGRNLRLVCRKLHDLVRPRFSTRFRLTAGGDALLACEALRRAVEEGRARGLHVSRIVDCYKEAEWDDPVPEAACTELLWRLASEGCGRDQRAGERRLPAAPRAVGAPGYGLTSLTLQFQPEVVPSDHIILAINRSLRSTLAHLSLLSWGRRSHGTDIAPKVPWVFTTSTALTLLTGMSRLTSLELSNVDFPAVPPAGLYDDGWDALDGLAPIRKLVLTDYGTKAHDGTNTHFLVVLLRRTLKHLSLLFTCHVENGLMGSGICFALLKSRNEADGCVDFLDSLTLQHPDVFQASLVVFSLAVTGLKTLCFRDGHADCHAVPCFRGALFAGITTLVIPRWWMACMYYKPLRWQVLYAGNDEALARTGPEIPRLQRLVLRDIFTTEGETEDPERRHPIVGYHGRGLVEAVHGYDMERWCAEREVAILKPPLEEVEPLVEQGLPEEEQDA